MNENIAHLLAALFILLIAIGVFAPLSLTRINDDNSENKIWKETVKHADEFVYSHISNDNERACFKLFDKDGKYLCEAILYLDDQMTTIDRGYHTIAWRSSNKKLSHKMFKLLYPRIPEKDLKKFVSNDELLYRLKNMN